MEEMPRVCRLRVQLMAWKMQALQLAAAAAGAASAQLEHERWSATPRNRLCKVLSRASVPQHKHTTRNLIECAPKAQTQDTAAHRSVGFMYDKSAAFLSGDRSSKFLHPHMSARSSSVQCRRWTLGVMPPSRAPARRCIIVEGAGT